MKRCFVMMLALGVAASVSQASITSFRSWLNANPATPNSTSSEWYGTRGVDGALMTSDGSSWYSPGFPFGTPLVGPRTSIGGDNGAAGPATFEGSWIHPGPGIDAVITFAPSAAIMIGRVEVHSELILNGLSGNGVTITVWTSVGGNTTSVGSTILTGTNDMVSQFDFPTTQFQPGDKVYVAVGDNGSYLYDHVNMDVNITVPAPGATGLMALSGLVAMRRRR